MKTILLSTAAVFAAAPVIAGPYVNVEANLSLMEVTTPLC